MANKLPSIMSTIPTGDKVTFQLAPEVVSWNHSAELASLPVLDTPQPSAKYKYSSSVVVFPKLVFWTEAKSVTDKLVSWLKSGQLVSYSFGATKISRCYISKLTIQETQWRDGLLHEATGTMELTILPDVTSVGVVKPIATKKPTARERKRSL